MKTTVRVICYTIILTAIIVGCLTPSNTRGQAFPERTPQDIPPYEVSEFGVPMQLTNGILYKTVVQGCEVFIVTTGKNGQSPAVAVATGRGCK